MCIKIYAKRTWTERPACRSAGGGASKSRCQGATGASGLASELRLPQASWTRTPQGLTRMQI